MGVVSLSKLVRPKQATQGVTFCPHQSVNCTIDCDKACSLYLHGSYHLSCALRFAMYNSLFLANSLLLCILPLGLCKQVSELRTKHNVQWFQFHMDHAGYVVISHILSLADVL